jgi:hypothetical protein
MITRNQFTQAVLRGLPGGVGLSNREMSQVQFGAKRKRPGNPDLFYGSGDPT